LQSIEQAVASCQAGTAPTGYRTQPPKKKWFRRGDDRGAARKNAVACLSVDRRLGKGEWQHALAVCLAPSRSRLGKACAARKRRVATRAVSVSRSLTVAARKSVRGSEKQSRLGKGEWQHALSVFLAPSRSRLGKACAARKNTVACPSVDRRLGKGEADCPNVVQNVPAPATSVIRAMLSRHNCDHVSKDSRTPRSSLSAMNVNCVIICSRLLTSVESRTQKCTIPRCT